MTKASTKQALIEMLETIEGGNVWTGDKVPEVRVYFGGDSYVAVTDEGETYGVKFVAGVSAGGLKRRARLAKQYEAKVFAALGVEDVS